MADMPARANLKRQHCRAWTLNQVDGALASPTGIATIAKKVTMKR